jgi:hypothetical protein
MPVCLRLIQKLGCGHIVGRHNPGNFTVSGQTYDLQLMHDVLIVVPPLHAKIENSIVGRLSGAREKVPV